METMRPKSLNHSGLRRFSGLCLMAFFFHGFQGFFTSPLRAAEPQPFSTEAADKSTPKDPAIPVLNAAQFKEKMKKLKGKVVVVNMWATWCVPCRQEFPLLIQLYPQYKSKGVELIALSNDDLQNLDDVRDFVKERRVLFPVFLIDPNDADALREAVYPQWTGGLPSTFFFNRDGVLKDHITGVLEQKDFETMVKPLL